MDRLSANDLTMLWPDDAGWPQDIGAVVFLEGAALLDADGHVRIDAIRAVIADRLHRAPHFRQRLYVPRRGFGRPLWTDAVGFDIVDHVNVVPVPAPGGETQLLHTVERLRRRPWDRSRPLWQMWLLPGISGGRVGLYIRVHHAIADGVAGVATLGAFLDPDPSPTPASPPPWTPGPPPSPSALWRDNLRRYRAGVIRALSTLAHPVAAARGLSAAWPAMHETLGAARAPRTSINRPIGTGRAFALLRCPLDRIRQVAHAHQATINDVLLTAVASGLRDLLRGRGERVDGLLLRAYVPVSLHRERSGRARGNMDGVMAVPLPVGVADPLRRLRLIADLTAQRKKHSRPAGGTLLGWRPVQRLMMRLMAHQRWANVYVANVLGPSVPLYFCGAPVIEVFPVVPLIGNITVGVGALSYAGTLAITTVADLDAGPDIGVFVRGVRAALSDLDHAPQAVA